MKLLFRQRFFSWFDSYDIYDENENTVYTVKGQLSWGHCLKIYDVVGREVGTVKERVCARPVLNTAHFCQMRVIGVENPLTQGVKENVRRKSGGKHHRTPGKIGIERLLIRFSEPDGSVAGKGDVD